jgi:tetraacyldisaccharide 4'-kinase
VRLRLALARPAKASLPVICVGNLVAGGSGKTPVALALGQWLQDHGCNPHFLSRGYGGSLPGPVQVNAECHHCRDTGDEALLLSRAAPAWVSRDRPAGAQAAALAGADVVIMDDGFQNPSLAKDLSLLVVDGEYGIGNGRLIPAGPLRENVVEAFSRASAVVVLGEDTSGIGAAIEKAGGRMPVLRARLAPVDGGGHWQGQKVLAFAGIGRPEKFFNSLREVGAELVAAHAFPDHYPYSEHEAAALVEAATAAGAEAVTTAKDVERLEVGMQDRVVVFKVRVQWEDAEALARLLSPFAEKVTGKVNEKAGKN